MALVRLKSSSIRAAAVFKVPLLSWTSEVPSRFFRAMYGSLNDMLYIQPSDLVAVAGVSLGDCSTALRILGGNSTLTLKATGVIADLPNVLPDRIDFSNSVILQGFEAFRTEFSELEIRSVESNVGHHFEVAGDGQARDILAVGDQTALLKRAHDIRDVVVEPALRFRLVSKDGKWSGKVGVEQSEFVENGIFLFREIVVSNLAGCETPQQQLDLITRIDLMIIELVGLEFESQVNDAD